MLPLSRAVGPKVTRSATVFHRRLIATPSNSTSPTGTPLPRTTQATATPGSSTLAAPIPPTSSAAIPPSASGTLPPPPPPRKSRGFFRRLLLYTTVGALVFYPASGWLSTKSEAYREFFVSNFPGAETLADYADDHWTAVASSKSVAPVPSGASKDRLRVDYDTRSVPPETVASRAVSKASDKAKATAAEIEDKAKTTAQSLENKAKSTLKTVEDKAKTVFRSAEENVKGAAKDVKDVVTPAPPTLSERAATAAHDAADKTRALAADAKERFSDATKGTPFNADDGLDGVARSAEKALGKGEAKVEEVAHNVRKSVERATSTAKAQFDETAGKVEDAASKAKAKVEDVTGPSGYLDTQRPRELRPETVIPKKPTHEGESVYTGPSLPLGHEPPPGYYIAPPIVAKVKEGVDKVKESLPLLGPRVKEFAASEPIISQLASTIDSLASSLSSPTSGDSKSILTRAQDDLSSLSKRLDEVKKTEKAKLEKAVGDKTKEFESILKTKEQEREKGEKGLREGWEKEREKLVDDWHRDLEKELEGQRQGIEQRLHEEVVSQGIELQRRWLRSIKSQVESERGGRLAKLDHLTTSLKQLERITLDNSATLDDNVRLHKVWSALRAVQAKAESGDVAFDDELRVLRQLSTHGVDASTESVVSATLNQLEKSGVAQTGVKSFAALANWFSNGVSPRVQSAALVPPPAEAGVLSHVASAAVSKVMFSPRAGFSDGDDVSSVLARAEWCLGEKDLDGAAREINSLKGWPAKLSADWLREARRRLEVQQALDIVGTEATLNSLLLV